MKGHAKKLIKHVEGLGYQYASTNTKGARRYEHPDAPPLLIQPGVTEDAARVITRQVDAALGKVTSITKRDPRAIRERQSKAREQHRAEHERHQKILARLRAEHDVMLAGHGANLTPSEIEAIEARIEQTERHVAHFARLMTEAPESRAHAGTARTAQHQSGGAA